MAIAVDHPCTRPSLLIRLRDPSDVTAWQQFVDLYGPILFRYCHRRGLQEHDAAEVMQEVLVQVSTSIRSFEYDRDRGQFRGWLTTVLKSKLSRYWKKTQRDRTGPLPLENVAGADDGLWSELCHQRVLDLALQRLSQRLSPEHWQAFQAVWVQRRSPAAVARDISKDVAWVYLVKSRGLQALQEIVQQIAADVPWFDAGVGDEM